MSDMCRAINNNGCRCGSKGKYIHTDGFDYCRVHFRKIRQNPNKVKRWSDICDLNKNYLK
jgi:ribosomal protein S14